MFGHRGFSLEGWHFFSSSPRKNCITQTGKTQMTKQHTSQETTTQLQPRKYYSCKVRAFPFWQLSVLLHFIWWKTRGRLLLGKVREVCRNLGVSLPMLWADWSEFIGFCAWLSSGSSWEWRMGWIRKVLLSFETLTQCSPEEPSVYLRIWKNSEVGCLIQPQILSYINWAPPKGQPKVASSMER